jgi:hypothetical protein
VMFICSGISFRLSAVVDVQPKVSPASPTPEDAVEAGAPGLYAF